MGKALGNDFEPIAPERVLYFLICQNTSVIISLSKNLETVINALKAISTHFGNFEVNNQHFIQNALDEEKIYVTQNFKFSIQMHRLSMLNNDAVVDSYLYISKLMEINKDHKWSDKLKNLVLNRMFVFKSEFQQLFYKLAPNSIQKYFFIPKFDNFKDRERILNDRQDKHQAENLNVLKSNKNDAV